MKRFFLVCGLVIALLCRLCWSSASRVETLKSWYDKLDTTDGAGMDRFYSHAAHYAAELSVDSDNPMTAEQVLFKFSRLAAITSVKSGEFGTIGTGSLGKQLEDIYHLLGCGDQLTAEQMETARKTLDICTLNEWMRINSSP